MSPSSGGSGSFVSSSVFSGVFTADEVYRVRDKGSGDTTIVDGQNFLEAFLNISLDLPVSLTHFDLVKSKFSVLRLLSSHTTLSELWD